ncbi:biotin-dependent carboxyltransferase family protein [Nocardia sp. NPDC047038]|uniref:5-oxoprolinase subunit C family protein n=1 Tax=Nocardia sp. NPDC047038 TaxID=3154338 RepID=UPI003402B076
MIEILSPGLSTTIQDTRERLGLAVLGIHVGGALDHYSATVANLLVGNDTQDAVLEAAYVAPSFVVHVDTAMAVTGGSVDVVVSGEHFDSWTTVHLCKGDVVELGASREAPRIYVAFSGGVDVPLVHGSRSTNLFGRFGGLGGTTLQKGDRVPLGGCDSRPNTLTVRDNHRLGARRRTAIHVVPVEPDDRLSPESFREFFSADWTVTPSSDRTGVRFSGPTMTWREREQPFGAGPDLSNTLDGGYPLGSIQIPGGSGPILLHRDGPTMGGYAVVGVVARADLDLVAQCMPQSAVRFRQTSRDEALVMWDQYRSELAALPEILIST